MPPAIDTLTITLHWWATGQVQTATIASEDCTPQELIPLLVQGCALPGSDRHTATLDYELRPHSLSCAPLDPNRHLSSQGLRSGAQLWLVSGNEPDGLQAMRCLLGLPGGHALSVPPAGLLLTRAWLLQAIGLFDPELLRSIERDLRAGRSSYRCVSKRPHCRIGLHGGGHWSVATDRSDVLTLLNGQALAAGRPALLQTADRVQIGVGGPEVGVELREYAIVASG
jgi:hypothetical protein